MSELVTGVHRYPAQEQVIYGRPAAEAVAAFAQSIGASRLLIVTTRSLAANAAAALQDALGARCVGVFSNIRAHSPREDVIACAEAARASDADLLVALGGGSVIDATKVVQLAIWAGAHTPDALDALQAGGGRALPPGVRMIAVPTTLSAAEFTPFAGVTDTGRKEKDGFFHPQLAPRAVILDPHLALATPLPLWFSTGMKAIDHAVEQLCNATRAPFGDAVAEDGLRRLAAGLAATRARPADPAARLECQFGMWLAISGAASGRGMGASHAIGHTLGGGYGVPHGVTSCVTLPAVMTWNLPATQPRQALIARLLGQPDAPAAQTVRDLAASWGLPTTLAAVGVSSADFPAIAKRTMHDNGVRANPRPIQSEADIIEILDLAR